MTIETDRLILRKFERADVDDVLALSSNKEVLKWTGDKGVTTKEGAMNIIENIWLKEYEEIGYARLAVFHKEDKRVIGFSGLKYEPDWGVTDIGYRFLPEYWGQGIATESAKPFIPYAFETLDLPSVVGVAFQINIGSSRILEKLGMSLEKSGITIDDIPHLCDWYSMAKSDYFSSKMRI